MLIQINFLFAFFLYLNIVKARSRYPFSYETYSKPDPIEADADAIVVDCHTMLHGDVMGNRYRLEASTVEDGRICDLRLPNHVLVAVEADFHDPETYFRVVGTNGNQGWTVGLPRIFSHNSTIPHHGHEREHTSVWFTPCDRSAILLNSKNTKDAIIIIIIMMKELPEEKLALYKDPIKCDDYLDLF